MKAAGIAAAALVLGVWGCCPCFYPPPPHTHVHHHPHPHPASEPVPKPVNQAHPGGGTKPAPPADSGALKKNFRCPECKATSETAMKCHGKPMVAVE